MSWAQSLGSGVTVNAVLDASTEHPRGLADAFPGGPAAALAAFRDTVGRDGRWWLPVYVFLIRAHGSTVLVDGGVGPPGTEAAEWLGATGSLLHRLATLGVAPETVDLVVLTHLHQDHVGWLVDPRTGRCCFERARYVVSEREWAAEAEAHRRHVEQSVRPLREAGLLETAAPGPLAPGVELVALPGHSPGHCGVLVTGPEQQALLVGDAFNHPLQVQRPEIPSGADADREQAMRSRHEVIERLQSGTTLAASAHLPGAWWRPRPTPDGPTWRRVSDAAWSRAARRTASPRR